MNTEQKTEYALSAEDLSKIEGKVLTLVTSHGDFKGRIVAGESGFSVVLDERADDLEGRIIGFVDVSDESPLKVWTCKNACGCNGIRYVGVSLEKFPCRLFSKFGCCIDEIVDLSCMPYRLRKVFLNGMSTPLPYKEK